MDKKNLLALLKATMNYTANLIIEYELNNQPRLVDYFNGRYDALESLFNQIQKWSD